MTSQIRGTWATVLTPFDDDDVIDFGALHDELQRIVAVRPDGMYTHGTSGEFFNQSDEEWLGVATAVAECAGAASIPFQIGASHSSPLTALWRIERARELRPLAIQVILPDWTVLNIDEIRRAIARYAAIAEPVGLVLYNPPHAKNLLGPAQLLQLCDEFPQIVGIKMADGDEAWYAEMAPLLRRLSIFIPGHHLATGLARGASGTYSNVACLSPRGAMEWQGTCEIDPGAGLAIESAMAAFFEAAIGPLRARRYSGLTLDKAMATAGGHLGDVKRVRHPLSTATEAEIQSIRTAAFELPEIFWPAGKS